jgi:AcrR family transcriptional regulator
MKSTPVRRRILETASRLFYQEGYSLVGINEIIAQAGVAKTSLYQHFSSKEELCVAFLTQKEQEWSAGLHAFLASYPNDSSRITGVFDYLEHLAAQPGFNGCWALNTFPQVPKDQPLILEEIRKQKEAFVALFKKLVEAYTPVADPLRVARRLYLLYEGALIESRIHREDWPIREAKALVPVLVAQ